MADPNIFNETFEGSGYAVMTGTTTIGPGSSLDPDYPTDAAGKPFTWGQQCLRATSVTPNTQARKNHTLGTAATGTLFFRDEIYIASESIPNGATTYIFSIWGTGFTPNIFHLSIRRDLPDFKIQAEFNNGGTPVVHQLVGLTTGAVFVPEVYYNTSSKAYAFRVNGTPIASGTLGASTAVDASWIVVGSDIFATTPTAALEVLHDNVSISDQGWLGPSWSKPQGRFLPQH